MNQPTTKVPCPMCGSENEHGSTFCTVCGCSLEQAPSNAGGHKCARCGQLVPEGFDFCPVCGLDQRQRFARPATKIVRIDPNAQPGEAIRPAPQPGGYPAPAPAPAPQAQPYPPQPAGYPNHPPAPQYSPPHQGAPQQPVPPQQPPYPQQPQQQPVPHQQPIPQPQPQHGGAPQHPGLHAAPTPGGNPLPQPSPQASPQPPPVAPGLYAPHPPVTPLAKPGPSKTGRTVFHDGPPLPRPPSAAEDDLTIPALSRGAEAPASLEPGLPVGNGVQPVVERSPSLPQPVEGEEATLPGEPGGPASSTIHNEGASVEPAGAGWGAPPAVVPSEAWKRPTSDPLEDAITSQSPVAIPPAVAVTPAVDFEDIQTAVEPPSAHPTNPGLSEARLVLVGRDGEEGDSFPMTGEQIAVGREQGDVLFPDDAFMSPAHARVERNGDVYTLVDLGSSNGIYLRIRGNATVYPGDLFMVGHQLLRLENVVEPVQEQPAGHDGTRLFGTPLKPAWGKLVLVGRGGVTGDHFYLRGAKVIFGREQGDLLFPQDPFVSREHARLRLELHGSQMSVFLEDLGSANGTYIRIRGSAEVRGRDTFRVGDQILRLRLDR